MRVLSILLLPIKRSLLTQGPQPPGPRRALRAVDRSRPRLRAKDSGRYYVAEATTERRRGRLRSTIHEGFSSGASGTALASLARAPLPRSVALAQLQFRELARRGM